MLLHDYFVWTYEDGKKQFITTSSMKPAVANKKYLLFLIYDETNEGYWPVSDYEGMYAIPDSNIKAKLKENTLKQADLEVYDYEPLIHLLPVYQEVAAKYFN